ncbi:hypothetical protein CBR_g4645 [Chara braunii]|uniref:CHRD domain-containing protein n=1 Tax=Chara braunii TaxID=69332 RepID=A0A388KIF8_CHABU|nr:hypothetical protein CBR_g4645 [Chara braunii]|eukprot:GBG69816.1 hypothetical protein CBR_g4645 [Chara braunii]
MGFPSGGQSVLFFCLLLSVGWLSKLAVASSAGGNYVGGGEYYNGDGGFQDRYAGTSDSQEDEAGQGDSGSNGDGEEPEAPKTDFAATLLGRNVMPGPGDDQARGTVEVKIDPVNLRLCAGFELRDLRGEIDSAAIYNNVRGKTGPMVVDLGKLKIQEGSNRAQSVDVVVTRTKRDPGARVNGVASTCVTLSNRNGPKILVDLRMRPDNYYVELDSESYVNGALRGQLYPGKARSVDSVNVNTIEGPSVIRNSAAASALQYRSPIQWVAISLVTLCLCIIGGAGVLAA